MGPFTKGDIVLFPFPYTDLSNRKIRPCLVLSEEMNEDVILCQITSKNINKDQCVVEINKDETIDGSLMIDSYVRTNMIFTAIKNQIHKKLCSVNNKRYEEITNMINKIMKK